MRYSASVSALLLTGWVLGAAAQQLGSQTAGARRANELTLAAVRPGRDSVKRVRSIYGKPAGGKTGDSQFSWEVSCRHEALHVSTDASGTIEEIRAELHQNLTTTDCDAQLRSPWRTGKNLALGDANSKVVRLYGEPDSRSPSTKDGQRLELLYYAFDWAGSDVPQVMEVLCTVEHDGKPGRVIEITLAASSL